MAATQLLAAVFLVAGYGYWLYQLEMLTRVSRRVPLLAELPDETRGRASR